MSASEFRELLNSKAIIPTKKGLLINDKPSTVELTGDIKVVVIKNLPKVSLNKFYAGMHWSVRNAIKDSYHEVVPVLSDIKFPIEVSYRAYFKNNPLDASNFVGGMVKLIEDVLFSKKDGYKQICLGSVKCFKGDEDRVEITIREIKKIL